MPEALVPVVDRLATIAPTVLWVVAIVLIGLLGSLIARRITRWGVRLVGLEELGEDVGFSKVLYAIGFRSGLAAFLGQVVFYAGLLLTLGAVAEVAGLHRLTGVLHTVTGFLPRALIALLLLVGGLWFAGWLSGLVERFSERDARVSSPRIVSRAIYYAVIVVTLVMVSEQLGLDTQLVTALIAITSAGLVFGFALVFALGARSVFGNVIARYYCEPLFCVGDDVELGGVRGKIVRYTASSVELATNDARKVIVPCNQLLESLTTVTIAKADAGE